MDSQHLPFPQKGLVMPSCICSQDPLPCRFAPDIGATWIKKAPVTPSEKAILCLRNPKNMSWWDFEGRCWILSHIYSILFMLNLGLTLVGRHSLVVWHGGWQNRFNKKKHLKKLDIGVSVHCQVRNATGVWEYPRNPRLKKYGNDDDLVPWYIFKKRTSDVTNVGKTLINHPRNHHVHRWYVYHSQSWVVYCIVLPTLILVYSGVITLW